jgi:hypothetical protein
MADVEDLDFTLIPADVIVDEKWAVHELADVGPFSDQATHARKTSQ